MRKSCPHLDKQWASSNTQAAISRMRMASTKVRLRNCSGETSTMPMSPKRMRSSTSRRSRGVSMPLTVAAHWMPALTRFSTWSRISDCSGEMTTVSRPERR